MLRSGTAAQPVYSLGWSDQPAFTAVLLAPRVQEMRARGVSVANPTTREVDGPDPLTGAAWEAAVRAGRGTPGTRIPNAADRREELIKRQAAGMRQRGGRRMNGQESPRLRMLAIIGGATAAAVTIVAWLAVAAARRR